MKYHWVRAFEMLCTFIGSKSFCQVEENQLINGSSPESNDESDYCDHQESTADRNAAELADANKENTGEKKRKKIDKGEFII